MLEGHRLRLGIFIGDDDVIFVPQIVQTGKTGNLRQLLQQGRPYPRVILRTGNLQLSIEVLL